MGLDPSVLKRRMGELSGGQTQRVLIAWALLGQADVLLLDEPTAAVDTSFEDTIYSVIHRIQTERRKTILLVSHDLNVVYRYAQNVLCLNHKAVCHGSPAEVLTSQVLAKLYGEAGYFTHQQPGFDDATRTSGRLVALRRIASGSIGPFILLRRMALVGDALSHVALPGIALALIYRLDPFYGVVVFQLPPRF